MARNLDGVDDFIDFASDASIDNLAPASMSMWIEQDTQTLHGMMFAKKGFATGWAWSMNNAGSIHYEYNWSGARGQWTGGSTLGTGTRCFVCVTYDRGAAAGTKPVMYFNGVSETVTVNTASAGTVNSDAAETLSTGKDRSFNFDFFDGRQGWLTYHSATYTAEDVNRAMWWGRPFGGLVVYHPFTTDKLVNEGTGTATGTATNGPTVVAFTKATPVVRPGTAMMGMGIGW